MFQVGNDWNSSGIVRLWDTLDTRFWNGISYFFAYLISMLCPKIGGQLPSTRLKASRSSKCGDYDYGWICFRLQLRGTFVEFLGTWDLMCWRLSPSAQRCKVYSYYWYMFTAFVYGKPQSLAQNGWWRLAGDPRSKSPRITMDAVKTIPKC